ncbi:hypothetical protein [uncultured Chryseobacterium sp.]|uniref:hypothetical protein n=1 Tax=uncultured Chryseobacterium sp. TaxID=259322 RepID=UPI0025F74D58|nr:hypothetical protein [uncultured Chryseobacterium sp.]
MKILSLKSPKIINFSNEDITAKISHQIFTENTVGVDTPINHAVLIILSEKNEEGKFLLPIDQQAIFGKESIGAINEIKKQIAACSQIAENLFSKLKALNFQLKQISELNDIFEKYNENYKKLDFMSHRNLFSDLINSKKINWINEIIKEYNIKSVTKSFYNLIIDRNKYTHGELMLYYPSRETILEYENESRNKEIAIVNSDIISSYIENYQELDKLLNKIETARQKNHK